MGVILSISDRHKWVSGRGLYEPFTKTNLRACVIFSPINAPGMGRFQLLNLGVLGYGSELKFWVVIAIIVCRERLFFRGGIRLGMTFNYLILWVRVKGQS